MASDIFTQLKTVKHKYAQEGFNILGVFGSYSRHESNHGSDVDILYDLDKSFIQTHEGFSAFARLSAIKAELEALLGAPIDLAAKSGLSRTGTKHILRDLHRV